MKLQAFIRTAIFTMLIAALALLVKPAPVAHADIHIPDPIQSGPAYIVNSVADADDGSCTVGDCTLREAINAANGDGQDSTITFSVTGIITLTGQLPDAVGTLTISGPGGAPGITISGGGSTRVIAVPSGVTLALANLTIANGYASAPAQGGAIRNSGTLNINHGTFSGNIAHGSQSNGGAIYNDTGGSVSIKDSTFSSNSARSNWTYGGAIYNSSGGTVTVIRSTFEGNEVDSTSDVRGGAICNEGNLTVADSTFWNNHAKTAPPAAGGGIYNSGTMDVSNTTFAGNSAVSRGGGLYNSGTMTLSGGAFRSNTADYGGGAFNEGTATLTDCAIGNNNNVHMAGGGFANLGTASLTRCTVFGNSGTGIQGGAGLYNGPAGQLTLTNATVTSNQTNVDGGGILAVDGQVTLINCTVTNNTADLNADETGGGGGIAVLGTGTVTLKNTIVAGNYDHSPTPSNVHPDLYGAFTSGGYNLIGKADGSAGFTHGVNGDQVGTIAAPIDPRLGPLTLNLPGTTQTHALLFDSPAIDRAAQANCPAADQRGEARNDLNCDVGAYELKYVDSDTVEKGNLTVGAPYTFGPSLVGMTRTTSDDPGLFSVRKVKRYPGLTADTGELMVWWKLTASGSSYNLDLMFCYTLEDLATLTGGTENNLRAYRWEGSGWVFKGGTVDLVNHCVTLPGVSDLGAWTVASDTPTAVMLREFGARSGPSGFGIPAGLAGTLALVVAGLLAYRQVRRVTA